MRTNYKIDDLQLSYFVIDDFDQLFDATRPDFTPYYDELRGLPEIAPGEVLPTDRLIGVPARAA
jgi:phenylalanine-4-hydroxylase